MPFSKEKIANLISLMQKTYPGWTDFSDIGYIKDEVEYKRNAIEKAHQLLNDFERRSLLDEGNLDEIILRFKRIGQAINLL